MASDQVLGVTPPMSVSLPTDAELRASDSLIEELRRQKTFESPSDTQKRQVIEVVLESLRNISDEFVKRVALEKEPKNEVLIRNARARVFTYGSYRLGVFGPGSDIDTLVVAPKYVTREDYFKYFPEMLVAMAPKGSISELAAVTDAFVPIIKFEYSGISIDLIFSRIIQKQIAPDQSLKDSNLLRGLDEAELRSLNGTRVTDEILDLVPESSTFKMALRAIKLWAQRRAVYANIMGFPGGVAWAMLVARVCQLYPKATTSVIVNKFFLVISQWRWPHPVLLKPIESGPLPVRVWNPKIYKGDSFHLMPIITPAYPSMCATFNITRSSMTIIQRELQRGLEITENIMMGKQPWNALFVKHTFFVSGYKYYISVIAAAKTKEAHTIWSGYVESKVRMLVQKLEVHPSIKMAHAFNKGYERRHRCNNDTQIEQVQEGCLDFIMSDSDIAIADAEEAGEIERQEQADAAAKVETVSNGSAIKSEADDNVSKAQPEIDGNTLKSDQPDDEAKSNPAGEDNVATLPPKSTQVYTTTHYIGLELEDRARSLDLSYQVDEFKALCTQWKKYEEELKPLASLGVQHVRNFNLPDDVFDAGEKKPQKKSAKSQANDKKRGLSENDPPPAKRQQQQASVTAAG